MRRYRDASSKRERDAVAVEEPLEIRLSWTACDGVASTDALAVTMRTPGDDFDLVAGFLHGEGVVRRPEHLLEMSYCRGEEEQRYNVVEARLRPGVPFDSGRVRRNFYTTSSCGVCGKASIEAVESHGCVALPDDGFRYHRGSSAASLRCSRKGRGSSAGPEACTPPRSSTRAAAAASCARTSVATTRSTRRSARHSSAERSPPASAPWS
jgi:hypothetical protein